MIGWLDVIGWSSAIVMLVAYVLVAARRLRPDGAVFHGLNVLGSAGLAANSAASGALPSTALNLIWLLIGVGAIATHVVRRSRTARGVALDATSG